MATSYMWMSSQQHLGFVVSTLIRILHLFRTLWYSQTFLMVLRQFSPTMPTSWLLGVGTLNYVHSFSTNLLLVGAENIFNKIQEVNERLRAASQVSSPNQSATQNQNQNQNKLDGDELHLTAPIGALSGFDKVLTDRIQVFFFLTHLFLTLHLSYLHTPSSTLHIHYAPTISFTYL